MNAPQPDAPARADSSTDPPRPGRLELICGCMFAGKTTELIRRLSSVPVEAVAVFRHNKDQRYSRAEISTHDGRTWPALTVRTAAEILERVGAQAQVVAIDEGHFYDPALPAVCRALVAQGRQVIVTTLDRDMWGLPFATIEQLRALADDVDVRSAVCARCGRPAFCTHRKTPIVQRNLVGGAGDFEPRCPECWSPPPEEHIDSANMA